MFANLTDLQRPASITGGLQSSRAGSPVFEPQEYFRSVPVLPIHCIHMLCFVLRLDSWHLPILASAIGRPDAIIANLFCLPQPIYPALPHQVILVRSKIAVQFF